VVVFSLSNGNHQFGREMGAFGEGKFRLDYPLAQEYFSIVVYLRSQVNPSSYSLTFWSEVCKEASVRCQYEGFKGILFPFGAFRFCLF